jgi:hypothetical protein
MSWPWPRLRSTSTLSLRARTYVTRHSMIETTTLLREADRLTRTTGYHHVARQARLHPPPYPERDRPGQQGQCFLSP